MSDTWNEEDEELTIHLYKYYCICSNCCKKHSTYHSLKVCKICDKSISESQEYFSINKRTDLYGSKMIYICCDPFIK